MPTAGSAARDDWLPHGVQRSRQIRRGCIEPVSCEGGRSPSLTGTRRQLLPGLPSEHAARRPSRTSGNPTSATELHGPPV